MKKHAVYFLLFGLCACELVVDVNIPVSPNQLTINSLFEPDSTWLVMLTNNRHILNDSSFQGVENAVVMIAEEGAVVDTLVHHTNGIYRSHARPVIGKEYHLIARTETSEVSTGNSTILKPEMVTKVELIKGAEMGHGRLNNKLAVTFADKSLEPNYYQIIVKTEYEQFDSQRDKVLSFPEFVHLESDDPALQSQIINRNEGVVIKDVLFNGKEVTLSFKTPENDLFQEGAVLVSLRTLSPEYYQYKTTAALQEHISGDPFAQPLNVYSNIKNGGYGIFAGFSQSEYYKETYPRPAITGVTPSKGRAGDHVIISGVNFTGMGYGITFKTNEYSEPAEIVRVTETEIEVIVPKDAITGKIAFLSKGRITVSPEDFEVIP